MPAASGLAGLASANSEERWAAVRAAAGLPDGVQALAGALASETDVRVREAIFTALARIGTHDCAAVVAPYIRSDDASLRTGALDALRLMPEAVAALLPALLADADADVRLLACDLARNLPGDAASRSLSALLQREPEANVCAAAVEVLAEVGGVDALRALEACRARFAGDPFLSFAITVAAERIGALRPRP